MLELKTPRGLVAMVPETQNEDPSPSFDLSEQEAIAHYYQENGYVVVRGLIASVSCQHMRDLWGSEVKPSRAHIYRQATAKAEIHKFNSKKWVMNPILNLQSVDPVRFPNFRKYAVEQILTAPRLVEGFRILFDEKPKIVQSMYFEGNSATWEHQDSYYLDSEKVGSMAAAWIALEDIDAEAGRFFVCPKSHLIDMGRQNSSNNIADRHEEYIQTVVSKIRALGLEIRAPRLCRGDVLFWNAWTIHGSLDSHSSLHSRSSITCHAIPRSHRFLQLQSRILPLNLKEINGIQVHHPKDLALMFNRLVLLVESNTPWLFYPLKKLAVKLVVSKKNW
jgi:phytanoyl-CoA hydroxylase